MLTRAEVIKGLESISISHNLPITGQEVDAAREAIALLQPPTTAEIEAARAWNSQYDTHHARVCDRALDALAREPGLEARVKELEESLVLWVKGEQVARIAALTAENARLRGELDAGFHHAARMGEMVGDQADRIAALEAERDKAQREWADAQSALAALEAKLAERDTEWADTLAVVLGDLTLYRTNPLAWAETASVTLKGLRDERDALQARLARVHALLAEWQAIEWPQAIPSWDLAVCREALRKALEG